MFFPVVTASLLIPSLTNFYSQLQSPVNDSAALNDVRTTDGTGSSEPADTSGFTLGLYCSGIVYIFT